METMAKVLHMRITLATVEYHEYGEADGDEPPKGLWRSHGEEDPSHLGFRNSEHEMSITHLVDLDGNLVLEDLYFNGSEEDGDGDNDAVDTLETIPTNLQDMIKNGHPDSQEYEGYETYGGALDRWYRRTVMVVWPIRYEARIIQGENYQAYALQTLTATKSKRASRHEQDLLDYLVNPEGRGGDIDEAVLRAVCTAACQWKNVSLWQQTYDEFRGHMMIANLGASRFYDAISCLGLENVQTRVEKTLAQEPRNALRLNFLSSINPELTGGDLSGLDAWILKQRQEILLSLKSLELEDVEPIVSAVGHCGNVTLLEKIVFQVKVNVRPVAICALAVQLHPDAQNGLFKSKEEVKLGRRLVRDLLTHSINVTNFFQPVSASATLSSYPYFTKPTLQPDSNLAYHHLVACVQTENYDLSQVIADKLTAGNNISAHATLVFVPLIPRLTRFAETYGISIDALPGFSQLHLKTLPFLLLELKCRRLDDVEIQVIFRSIDLGGGLEYLMESVLPNLNVGEMDFASFRKFVTGLKGHKWVAPVETVVTNLVDTMVREIRPSCARDDGTGIQLMEVAYETGNSALCGDILSRIFLEEPRPLSADHVSKALGPSIRPIRAFLTRHGVKPTSPPFASYLEKVISAKVRLDLGPKPTDMSRQLASICSIKCTCRPCTQLIKFFETSRGTLEFPDTQTQVVNHVQAQLQNHCGAQLARSNTSYRRPLTLFVHKTEAVLQHSAWQLKKQNLLGLIKLVSFDESTLHQILGAEGYQKLLKSLDVRFINAALQSDQSVSALDAMASNLSTENLPVQPALSAPQTSNVPPSPKAAVVAPHDAHSPPRKRRKT